MNTLHKVNIILGLLLLGLIGLTLLDKQDDFQPLTRLDSKQIQSVILHNDSRTLAFARHGDSWQLTTAGNQPANTEIINKLLGIAHTHSYREFENTAANRKLFKLEVPRYRITLDKLEIFFGSTEPAEQHRYILVDNRIHLITDLYLRYLLADQPFFIDQ